MKLSTLLVILSFLLSQAVIAQGIEVGVDSGNTVTVNKDWRFDELSAKQAELNKRAQRIQPKRMQGWRIQAANTQNRDEANAVKAEMLRRFPEHKSYLLYQSPNFRVRVGDFPTQKEAYKLRKLISALYPGKGIYIVPDVVEIAPEPEEDDLTKQ